MLEPGLGKTKLALDTALLLKDKISKVFIIIPSGLKSNWEKEIYEETDWIQEDYEYITYPMLSRSKVNRNTNSIVKNSLLIIDESHFLKNPKSKRTKLFLKLIGGREDIYLLSLSGTPNPKNILDMWIQCVLVNGWTGNTPLSYCEFSNIYGEWMYMPQYRTLIGEKNRPILLQGLKDKMFFVKKEDVLDLPPKLYEIQYYELSSEQKKLIKELKKEAIAQVEPTLDYVSATIHNYMMICSGFLNAKYDISGNQYGSITKEGLFKPRPVKVNLRTNPKMELFKLFLESNEEKCIIYCSYVYEVELIEIELSKLYLTYTTRLGKLGVEHNQKSLEFFQVTDIQYLVATTKSTKEGLNIPEAHLVVYFSNTTDLLDRLQSEDRIHRLTQKYPCTYIDFVSSTGADGILLKSLKEKKVNMDSLFKEMIK